MHLSSFVPHGDFAYSSIKFRPRRHQKGITISSKARIKRIAMLEQRAITSLIYLMGLYKQTMDSGSPEGLQGRNKSKGAKAKIL